MKPKFIFPFLLFITCTIHSSAQANWLWAKTGAANASGFGEGYAVSADAAGNVFITGGFIGQSITFGSTTLLDGGGGDAFLVKYDASGNMLWAKDIGGASFDYGDAVKADASGNVIVTGTFNSSTLTIGSFTLTNAGPNEDAFVAKYDANGNVLWATSIGGNDADLGYGVTEDANGNVFVAGSFRSPTMTVGSTTFTNSGFADIFIVKYDSNGNVVWAKSAGGTSIDEASSVSVDPTGNIFITGIFESPSILFGATSLTNAGMLNVFVAKYDTNGNVLWAKSASGTGLFIAHSLSADVAGNVFVAGSFSNAPITFGTTTLNNAGASDVFVAKYDANGNVLWAKGAGGSAIDNGFCVSADAGTNFYLTGQFESGAITFGSSTLTRPQGATDPMFVVRFDTDGNAICAEALSSGGDDQNGVCTDAFGNAYVCSDFEANPFVIGSNSLIPASEEDVFVAKYSCCPISIHLSADTTISLGGTATLTASGGTTYIWSNGGTDSSIFVAPSSSTNYCVTATNENNCTETVCVTVNVSDDCASDIAIANAFSPNGDGQNDFVLVHCRNALCVNTFYIAIYDRWGEKVFESNDPNFKWDGSYKGKIMFTQVLDYFIRTTDVNGEEYVKKGNISLVL